MASQNWSLICDLLLSRGLEAGLVFQLRQGEVLLLCEVIALPHLNITEQVPRTLLASRYNFYPNNIFRLSTSTTTSSY